MKQLPGVPYAHTEPALAFPAAHAGLHSRARSRRKIFKIVSIGGGRDQ